MNKYVLNLPSLLTASSKFILSCSQIPKLTLGLGDLQLWA